VANTEDLIELLYYNHDNPAIESTKKSDGHKNLITFPLGRIFFLSRYFLE